MNNECAPFPSILAYRSPGHHRRRREPHALAMHTRAELARMLPPPPELTPAYPLAFFSSFLVLPPPSVLKLYINIREFSEQNSNLSTK